MTIEPKPKFPKLKSSPKTIASLYPLLKAEEQAEAEYVLKRYVALVWRIYQRLRREKTEKFDENPFKR